MQNDHSSTHASEPSEPFPGGELTVERAAKLLGSTTAEAKAMVADGRLASRSAPKPGGGEHTLVSLASVQAMRAEETSSPSRARPAAAVSTEQLFDLSRRPTRPSPPASATASAEPETAADPSSPPPCPSPPDSESLTHALNRLAQMHGELLVKLDELVAALRQRRDRE